MKLTNLVTATLLTLTLGVAGVALSPATTSHAKAKTTLKTFPKRLRGTWYADAGKIDGYHYYNGVRFTAKQFYFQANVTKNFVGFPLHAHKLPFTGTKKGHLGWAYATKHHGLVKVAPWNRNVTLPLAGYYRKTTTKIKGHKVTVVQQVSANKKEVYYQYYATKKLARQFAKH